jgi:hypothetical protein
MTEKIATACGAGARTLTIPPWLLATAVRAASLLPAFRTINAEMVRRQARDMVFDDIALREALDYKPRPFEPTPADFEVPREALNLQLPSP